jgi:hypothetical protein
MDDRAQIGAAPPAAVHWPPAYRAGPVPSSNIVSTRTSPLVPGTPNPGVQAGGQESARTLAAGSVVSRVMLRQTHQVRNAVVGFMRVPFSLAVAGEVFLAVSRSAQPVATGGRHAQAGHPDAVADAHALVSRSVLSLPILR